MQGQDADPGGSRHRLHSFLRSAWRVGSPRSACDSSCRIEWQQQRSPLRYPSAKDRTRLLIDHLAPNLEIDFQLLDLLFVTLTFLRTFRCATLLRLLPTILRPMRCNGNLADWFCEPDLLDLGIGQGKCKQS